MPTQTPCDDRRPFLSAPNPGRYFAAAASEEARRRILRAVLRREGPAMVIGAVGVGKTMLLAVLARQLAEHFTVVTLAGAQLCTRRALLQVILFELGLDHRGLDEGALRLAIVSHLRSLAEAVRSAPLASRSREREPAAPRGLVLLVDEADSLPVRLLEELRAFTNIAPGGESVVSLVLAGGPGLEERFAEPQLEAFSQRIAARTYLAPLGRDETIQYVRAQAAAAGIQPDELFAPDAVDAIFAATGGVPRLVNQLGDQACWMAEETGCMPLDAALVQQAWSDLQQLPAPWNTTDHAAAPSVAGELVEFGELDGGDVHDEFAHASASYDSALDDADDDLPASIPIAAALEARDAGSLRTPLVDSADTVLELLDELEELDGAAAEEPAPAPAAIPLPPRAVDPFEEDFGDEEVLVDRYFAFDAAVLRKAPQTRNRVDPLLAIELGACTVRPMDQPAAPARPEAPIGAPEPPAAEEPLAFVSTQAATLVVQAPQPVEPDDGPHQGWAPIAAAAPPAAASNSLLAASPEFTYPPATAPHAPPVETPLGPPTGEPPVGDLLVVESPPARVPAREFRQLFTRLAASGSLG